MSEEVAYAVSVVLGILVSLLWRPTPGWRGYLWSAVASTAVSTALTTLFFLMITMNRVNTHLEQEASANVYSAAKRQLAEVSDRAPLIDARRRKLKALDDELDALTKGKVLLATSGDVVAEWLDALRSSRYEVLATNIVRPGIWLKNAELRGPGREVQQRALTAPSPVTIKRIWLYSTSDEASHEALLAVSLDQRAIGINIRYLSIEELNVQPFAQAYLQRLGSADIVLFDGGSILVTTTDPSDHSILNGYVTTDAEIVHTGQEFFERLWSIARDSFYR